MGVIPNPKMAFIFPISCILALIFPILIKYFPKCVRKGSFPKIPNKITGSRQYRQPLKVEGYIHVSLNRKGGVSTDNAYRDICHMIQCFGPYIRDGVLVLVLILTRVLFFST